MLRVSNESATIYYKKNPLKLYIQDIFRAKQSNRNKYVYGIFGKGFKTVMLHGVVTSVYNSSPRSSNIELSDPTGSVHVYCNSTKNNNKLTTDCVDDLTKNFAKIYKFGNKNVNTMSLMLTRIQDKSKNIVQFNEGDFVCVVGDIFVDEFKNARMIAAYEWYHTSIHRDLIWMEELRYLYDKCYISADL